MPHPSDPALETLLAEPFGGEAGSVMPPIFQSSLFTFDSYQDFEDRMAGRSDRALYTRVQNPTVAAFEGMMARAERGAAAVGFASGMAAISSTVLAFLKPGDRVACVEHVYPDAYRLFERMLRPFGIAVDYHPVAAFEDDPGLLDGVAMAYLESPNSVVFQPMNLTKVAAHARRHGALTVIDNSWATPVFQRPLETGIDIVVHSASKYIGGHSDTVAGVVVSSAEHIARIRDLTLPLLGAKLAPFEAWLLIRGLRTLGARMRAAPGDREPLRGPSLDPAADPARQLARPERRARPDRPLRSHVLRAPRGRRRPQTRRRAVAFRARRQLGRF